MHVAVIGTECLGVASAAQLADYGHTVECIDTDARRVAQLNAGMLPFYEPRLREVMQKQITDRNLRFSTDAAGAAARASAVFLTTSAPASPSGEVDLNPLLAAASAVVPEMRHGAVLVVRSAVPVGTGALLEDLVIRRARPGTIVDVVANPEFMRMGSALHDLTHPERVVMGTRNDRAAACMRQLFESLYVAETPIIETTLESAELIKFAADAFLTIKIGFANELAALCDRLGADIHLVTTAVGLDRRIGLQYLRAGAGIGGPSLLSATRQLVAMGGPRKAPQLIAEAALAANEQQLALLFETVSNAIAGLSPSSVIAILGAAFKPETSDVRESPAIALCGRLAASGAIVRVFDPVAMSDAKPALQRHASQVVCCDTPYDAVAGADAIVAMTAWEQFRHLDWRKIRQLARHPKIVDARNMFDPSAMIANGFEYWSTGRQVHSGFARELKP